MRRLSLVSLSRSILGAGVTLFTMSRVMAAPQQAVRFLNPPASTAPFSEAVEVGGQMYLSGQLGLIPGQGRLPSGGLVPETKQALANMKTLLEKYGYSMQDVAKCTVLLADMADFAAFNKLYLSAFSKPYPVRTLFSVNGLAFGGRVELDCVAAK